MERETGSAVRGTSDRWGEPGERSPGVLGTYGHEGCEHTW